MLYMIETNEDGAVKGLTACPNGIDEVIGRAASELTHPEEDFAASCDVIAGQWDDLVESTPVGDPVPYSKIVFSRRGYPSRFGLAVAEDEPVEPTEGWVADVDPDDGTVQIGWPAR